MSGDLRTLLLETTPDEVADLDVDRLVRRGTRRRRVKRAGATVAVLAVLTTGSVAVLDGSPTDRVEIAPLDDVADQVPADDWQPLPAAPMAPREGATVATDGDLVAIFGGESEADVTVDGTRYGQAWHRDGAIYDAARDGWRPVPPGPLPTRAGANVELAGGQLVAVGGRALHETPAGGVRSGGEELTLDSARFDLTTSRWHTMGAPDIAPRTPDLVRWDGERLVLWGGTDDELVPWMDGATWTEADGWTTIPPAPLEARTGAAVGVAGDRLVVWGGTRDPDRPGSGDLFADGAVLDLTTGEWAALPESPLAARWIGHDAWPYRGNVRVDGDRVLIAGGATTGTGQERDGAWLDLRDGRWSPITPAPHEARFVTARRGGLLAVDDTVTDADPYVTLWRYDEDRDGWDRTSTRLRASLAVHDLSPERILVSSDGDDGRWQDSPRVGLWEAGERTLVHTVPPLSGRMQAHIAPLPDGVLVWGGRLIEPVGDDGVDSRAAGDGARLDR